LVQGEHHFLDFDAVDEVQRVEDFAAWQSALENHNAGHRVSVQIDQDAVDLAHVLVVAGADAPPATARSRMLSLTRRGTSFIRRNIVIRSRRQSRLVGSRARTRKTTRPSQACGA
jgi:hypothetical protein